MDRCSLLVVVASCAVACAQGSSADIGNGGSVDTPSEPRQGDPGQSSGPTEDPTPPTPTEIAGSYTMDLSCSDIPLIGICVIESKGDKDVPFTLPAGTKRSSIQYTVAPQGPDAGGTVDWASADPLDATVHIHGWAGAFSSVHIEVSGVTAVPDP